MSIDFTERYCLNKNSTLADFTVGQNKFVKNAIALMFYFDNDVTDIGKITFSFSKSYIIRTMFISWIIQIDTKLLEKNGKFERIGQSGLPIKMYSPFENFDVFLFF